MKRSFKDKLLDATYRGGKDRYKADVQSIKDEWTIMRAEIKEGVSFRGTLAIEREKQRKKEAERNPGMFKRVLFGTAAVIYVILAVPLTLSIIGIPIAAVLIALAIYSCKRYVFKQPTEYKEETK